MGQQIIVGAFTLAGVLVGALANHFLERQRKKEELIFQSKKETYAKILVGMGNSFLWGDIENLNNNLSDPGFRTKIKLRASELLLQGRLLAEEKLSNKFREFFDNEQKLWEAVDKNTSTLDLSNKRATLAKEIEDLMKKEIGL